MLLSSFACHFCFQRITRTLPILSQRHRHPWLTRNIAPSRKDAYLHSAQQQQKGTGSHSQISVLSMNQYLDDSHVFNRKSRKRMINNAQETLEVVIDEEEGQLTTP